MRCHTLTTVFVGRALDPDQLCAGDDAADAAFYPLDDLPQPLCFDHAKVIGHFRDWREGRRPLLPCAEDPAKEYGEIAYTRPF
jgi:8-oxo-dGTP diphosphatase